ncbi:glycosyltransferase family 39 protein [Pelagibacteraceae bacterium]|nr:glycosyltransferase family 39 protein [Pelagibacteraceae bacterium]
MLKKKNIHTFFIGFLIFHLFIWTTIPLVSNINLPLDVIEALAWGSNLSWGWDKHPPLSVFFPEIFFKIFGNQDWAYYLLSQIFVVLGFIGVWKLSKKFFKNKFYSLISVLLLESIYFYNFTTPEFNVNVCQIPFWSFTVLYCWKSIEKNKTQDWILFGVFAGLGFLSKYLFIYLLISITIFFLYKIYKEKKFNFKYLIPGTVFFVIIIPHLIWLYSNNFITISYGLDRTELDTINFLNYILNPLLFTIKQLGILIPFTLLLLTIVSKFKINIDFKDKKMLFLFFITIVPFFLIFLTSFIMGAKIRTMWMTPFYLFIGVFFVYIFESKINLKKIKNFLSVFLILFIFSPALYLYISISKSDKRTDYPGKEIAYLVKSKWDQNFNNEIDIIVGDEWFGGNLSYHLNSRPKWFNKLEKKQINKISSIEGVVYVGNPEVLKKICPGVYGTIKPIGICMIGSK